MSWGSQGGPSVTPVYTNHKKRYLDTAAGASHGNILLKEAWVLIRTWRACAALRRRAELETS